MKEWPITNSRFAFQNPNQNWNVNRTMCWDYANHDKLFNGANGVFQYPIKLESNESLIWIGFNNPKAGSIIRMQN